MISFNWLDPNDREKLYLRNPWNNVKYIDETISLLWSLIYFEKCAFRDHISINSFHFYKNFKKDRMRYLEYKENLKKINFVEYFLNESDYLNNKHIMYIISDLYSTLNYNVNNYYLSRNDIYNDIKYFLLDHFKTI